METSTPSSRWQKHVHNFDIDNYLNLFVPRSRLYILPRPISHFLGYRPKGKTQSQPANPVIWLSGCIGGFIGIAIISAVYRALPVLGGQQVPIVIASFGAAAILEYNTIESPLSQPRNIIIGHFLSALVGVGITKAFAHLPPERFDDLKWLAGATSVGVASFVMGATKTVHPPAGATALLAATSFDITALGWWLLPLVLLASVLMVASALLINNLTRRWPLYWWTPVDLSKTPDGDDVKHNKDVEKQPSTKPMSIASSSDHLDNVDNNSEPGSDTTVGDHADHTQSIKLGTYSEEDRILISTDEIVIPDWMEVTEWEKEVLEIFKQKLQRRTQTAAS